MRRFAWLSLLPLLWASHARAEAIAVDDLSALHQACVQAERPGRRSLYVVTLAPGDWRFGPRDDGDDLLPVDARSNLRALGGAAQLISAHMEPFGFRASATRAEALRGAARGATLRVGFFLGFDDRGPALCLMRSAVGVTTVRMDVAYVEMSDPAGRVLARDDTDRLRAWRDDVERDGVPGTGPRGAAGRLSMDGRARVPSSWQRAVTQANTGALGAALRACHQAGIERGAAASGQIVVRLAVAARTGRITGSEVELSSIGDRREASCVAEAVAALQLPAAPLLFSRVALRVPVRLRN